MFQTEAHGHSAPRGGAVAFRDALFEEIDVMRFQERVISPGTCVRRNVGDAEGRQQVGLHPQGGAA